MERRRTRRDGGSTSSRIDQTKSVAKAMARLVLFFEFLEVQLFVFTELFPIAAKTGRNLTALGRPPARVVKERAASRALPAVDSRRWQRPGARAGERRPIGLLHEQRQNLLPQIARFARQVGLKSDRFRLAQRNLFERFESGSRGLG